MPDPLSTPPRAGVIAAIRVGRVSEVTWRGETVRTGAFKEAVTGDVAVGPLGLAGDEQGDLVNHGGPDKAVLCYGRAHYADWRDEGIDLPEGAFFENLTVDGLTEADVCLGDRWRAGDVLFEVSQARQPCWKLSSRWSIPDLARRVKSTGRSGWYLRVVETGDLRAGTHLVLVDRWPEAVDLAEIARVMNVDKHDAPAIERVMNSPGLPEGWRAALRKRLGERVGERRQSLRVTDEDAAGR
ncbi:MOSC domain-containing protein [Citricoccus sp. GCM10030269]|uniref:MOSC domain-containing protein n=1 Tax=Citricoccus sp. GCM10030269 TaxID=3273388 RepID=UPI00361EEA2E